MARVHAIVSSLKFKDWASQQSGSITTAQIRNSPLWSPTALCKSMNWELNLLDSECGLGLTVADIVLPRLLERMVSIWEKRIEVSHNQRRPSLPHRREAPQEPGNAHLTIRHYHIIDDRLDRLEDFAPGVQNHQPSLPTNPLFRLLHKAWDKWLYNSTWRARTAFSLFLLPCLLLHFDWYSKTFAFLWWAFLSRLFPLLLGFLSWIWKHRSTWIESPTIIPLHATSPHFISSHTTSSAVSPTVSTATVTSSTFTPSTSAAIPLLILTSLPTSLPPSSVPPHSFSPLPLNDNLPVKIRPPVQLLFFLGLLITLLTPAVLFWGHIQRWSRGAAQGTKWRNEDVKINPETGTKIQPTETPALQETMMFMREIERIDKLVDKGPRC